MGLTLQTHISVLIKQQTHCNKPNEHLNQEISHLFLSYNCMFDSTIGGAKIDFRGVVLILTCFVVHRLIVSKIV